MVYTRTIFSKLESELNTKEITVITGMRRVGKTTALLHLFDLIKSENKAIFDLENPLHRKIFEEDNFDAIWSNLRQFGISNSEKAYIFLDEVQNLPKISHVVKYLYDHWEVKFILTGSSSYYLRNLFPESLAGRKIVFEIYPLTFSEFLVFKGVVRNQPVSFKKMSEDKNKISHEKLSPLYREYLEYGGFPSVVLEPNLERKKVLLSEIFTSYFEKDAKNLADFKEMSKLRDLILLLIPRIGSRVEILKLATELSVSRETIYSYLAFLEQTYFIFLLPRYSGSINRQAAGSRKLFLCDGGIANILGKSSEGQLFEQSVFQNVRPDHKLAFYSKENGAEIDFIIDGKIALESKITGSQQDIATLRSRSKSINLTESYIVTYQYSDKNEIIVATDF